MDSKASFIFGILVTIFIILFFYYLSKFSQNGNSSIYNSVFCTSASASTTSNASVNAAEKTNPVEN